MTTDGIGKSGAKTIGFENEGVVNRGNDAAAQRAYEEAKAAGKVTLTPMKAHEVVKLKAELKGAKHFGDRSVDLGKGETLINCNDRVYLKSGDSYSTVSGFTFPPLRMASPRRF